MEKYSVKLSFFYCCVFYLTFAAASLSAQTEALKKEKAALDEELLPEEEEVPQVLIDEYPPAALRLEHENMIWGSSTEGSRQSSYFLDRALVEYRQQDSSYQEQRGINWTLGLGDDSERLAEGSVSWSLQQQKGLSLSLSWDGAFYDRSTDYQRLDRQYSDAYRSGADFAAGESFQTHKMGGSARIADRWEFGSGLSANAEAQLRRDSYRVDGEVDDLTRFQVLGGGLRKAWKRISWDISGRRSELLYEGRIYSFRQLQTLDEASTGWLFPLYGRLNWGFGYMTYALRDVRALRGPTLTLQREADERFGWKAVARYLYGDEGGNLFGELSADYRFSRRQRMKFNLQKNIDLFSSYSVLTVERLPLVERQVYNLRSTLSWDLQLGQQLWTLQGSQGQQDYDRAKLKETALSITLSAPWGLVDTFTWTLEGQRNEDLGAVLREARRDHMRALVSWKHLWGSRLFASQAYLHMQLAYERLLDERQDYDVERYSGLIGIGQNLL